MKQTFLYAGLVLIVSIGGVFLFLSKKENAPLEQVQTSMVPKTGDCFSYWISYSGAATTTACDYVGEELGWEKFRFVGGRFFAVGYVDTGVISKTFLKESVPAGTMGDVSVFVASGEDVYFSVRGTSTCTVYRNFSPIAGADCASFIVVGKNEFPSRLGDSMPSIMYTKDANFAYYRGEKVEGADPSTFSIVPVKAMTHEFAKDVNRVYYHENAIPQADPVTFKSLLVQPYEGSGIGEYSVDKSHAFYKDILIQEADLNTFEAVIYDYAKDMNHVYKEGKIVPDADPETFAFPEHGLG